jgi:DNA primase small subunit
MTKPKTTNLKTTEFIKQRFTDYYNKNDLLAPSSLDRREWGFVMFTHEDEVQRMRRHIGFIDEDDLFKYIRSSVPRHVYYSTAYYTTPHAGTMDEKGWIGSDLIFDLDADHLMHGAYDKMMIRVKEETEKLLSMLIDELGFDQKKIELVFSGGRGYHVHVRDKEIRGWKSSDRREIIDYVCGVGLDPVSMFSVKNPSKKGWHTRYRNALIDQIQSICSLPEDDAVKYLTSMEGIGKGSAVPFIAKKDEIINHIRQGDANILKNNIISRLISQPDGEFKKRLLAQAAIADEPVTTDTKRLIRMPTSLHGGSGMCVQTVEIKDLHDFDPLVDTIVFSDKDTKVELLNPMKTSLGGNAYDLQMGVNIVPEYLAVFLCCRGMAEIV